MSGAKTESGFFESVKKCVLGHRGAGQITISTNLKDNQVYVAIRDTGREIRQEDLESIFDPNFTTKMLL